ncbi:hypothetical protein [Streptomyces noursei]|uniref:hypothetical protein n=1 Tax=Streptomyces noursei TaxID=1971 RepID=UPI002898B1A6
MSTALSETWNTAATSSRVRPATNAATARSRRVSCADGDNCRASPTSSLTQGSTTQNTYRFGSTGQRQLRRYLEALGSRLILVALVPEGEQIPLTNAVA